MINRRNFLFFVQGITFGLGSTRYGNAFEYSSYYTDKLEKIKPNGKIICSPPNCYFSYPHANGFLSDDNCLLISQINQDNTLTYLEWNYVSGAVRAIYQPKSSDMYCDIAASSQEIFFIRKRKSIIGIKLKAKSIEERIIYSPQIEDKEMLNGMLSVTQDATRILFSNYVKSPIDKEVASSKLYEYNIQNQHCQELCKMPFAINHHHYSPYDSNWIGFAHEGNIKLSLDRVWGLNRLVQAGQPNKLWDERASDGQILYVGHERWAFHRAGALVVAYPSSPGGPKGLYFIDANKKAATLISASDYDAHCNISLSGKYAVVDTLPPIKDRYENDGRLISDIILVDMANGKRTWLARSHAKNHPWHPHPHITPDEKYVVFNDSSSTGLDMKPCVTVVPISS